jgi:hypothetical protein
MKTRNTITALLLVTALSAIGANTTIEFEHILNCQVSNPSDPAYGAINNVWGAPTWIVPGEMAVAATALKRGGFVAEAHAAADYLVRVQNADGSWCNQYNGTAIADANKYARHTAQIMILLGELGGYSAALNKANTWLTSLQDPKVKTGADDGLICGGKSSTGGTYTDRWTSDNAFAVRAFAAAGNMTAKTKAVNGINTYLVSGDHWIQRITARGRKTDGDYGWINFAPAFMSLNAHGVTYPAGLSAGIRTRLQLQSGANNGAVYETQGSNKLMPGIGFQASIAWNGLGAFAYSDSHTSWAENVSALWVTSPDANGDIGGWIDWKTLSGTQANWWERFIDTSAYYIMAVNRWQY